MAVPPAHSSNDNVIRFYTAWGSPFAERVWIALDKKGVRYEAVEVDLKDKPEEMLRSNPRGKVPALVHKGRDVLSRKMCAASERSTATLIAPCMRPVDVLACW
jgi:glutaredoxin